MAFYEFRKFNFFDLKKGVDNGSLAAALEDSDVTSASSGNSQLVFGDSKGFIHIVSRSWEVNTFRAYELQVRMLQQLRNSLLLVSIGEDEPGINPVLKVWDLSKLDNNKAPTCVRVSRCIPQNRAVEASSMCVHDGLQLLAIGFTDGSVILYRGNITRDRASRMKVFKDDDSSKKSNSPITGLSFKTMTNNTYLFVATTNNIFLYNITYKDKEYKTTLDYSGANYKCSVLAESLQDGHFMIGRNDAIYCYTIDGRGPCYAVEGEKVMMEWFRSYLVIILKSVARPGTNNQTPGHLVTVLDLHNRFIVFQAPVQGVKAVLCEWGAFYILGGDNELYHLDEKDLQSKLSLLFKKNLYDVAIRIAKSQQYDSDGLIDIFRQYGDHLYAKGDPAGAVEQYIKTIGKLEASYVIRKFLDSQYINMLIRYLQALHKQGHAIEDHTTLLLNCYKKEDKTEELKAFVMTKDRELDFDVEIAIKVCRQVSSEDALSLAKKHEKHDWYLKIQIEDHQKYMDALNYIANLEFDQAELYMKKYGNVLIQNVPDESTQFLKELCSDYIPKDRPLVSENMLNGYEHIKQKADPEDYIHLFLNNSTRLVEFLEYLVADGQILSVPVYDTLLEHYLIVWDSLEDEDKRKKYGERILKLLQNPDARYDKHQALVVCHMHQFSLGVLHLYEEQKLYQRILGYHLSRKDADSVLSCCLCFDNQEPSLWVQALWACVRGAIPSEKLLPKILETISKLRLLSPMLVIDALGTGSANIQLGYVRQYILSQLEHEQNLISKHTEYIQGFKNDSEEIRKKIEQLRSTGMTFQGSRCQACHHQLELPSLHFLCQHSYHQHCFQSFSDNENECPECQRKNKSIIDQLKAREHSKDLHESFHSLLDRAPDGFSLAAEYFGRSVFNKVTIVTEPSLLPAQKSEKQLTSQKKIEEPKPTISNITKPQETEGRLRLVEGKSTLPQVVPMSEGRMRIQERQYSNSLEANLVKTSPKISSIPKESPRDSLSANIINRAAKDYDDSKNPFNDGNPFGSDEEEDDDEYDKNLNPFAS